MSPVFMVLGGIAGATATSLLQRRFAEHHHNVYVVSLDPATHRLTEFLPTTGRNLSIRLSLDRDPLFGF